MDFNNVIELRHSIRNFQSQRVSVDKIEKILEAARMAPSWENEQCWRFIIVDDSALKRMVADTVPHENPAYMALNEAPVIILLCADPRESAEIGYKDYYMVDTGIAMEHLILAAVNEGLGTCWVAVFNEEKIKDILDIPIDYRIVALTPIGFPREINNTRNRKNINEIAFRNAWNNPINNTNTTNLIQ